MFYPYPIKTASRRAVRPTILMFFLWHEHGKHACSPSQRNMCPPWHLSPSEICPPRIFSNWMNYRWVFYQISVPVYLNFLSSIHIHSYHLNVIHVFYICYQSTIYLFIIWHSSSIYYPKPVIYLAWSCYFETVSLLVHLANCRKQSQSICGHLKNIFRLYH